MKLSSVRHYGNKKCHAPYYVDRRENPPFGQAALEAALRRFEGHLGDVCMVFDRLVERRRDDFPVDRPTHVGHFLRPLADEEDHEMEGRVIVTDAVTAVLWDERL